MTSVAYKVEENIARIIINRPERRNTLDNEVTAELDAALDRALEAPEVRAIVLEGEGESFCAGWNLNLDVEALGDEVWPQWMGMQKGAEHRRKWWTSRKPIVCKVQGYALGAGFELAQLADFVIASDDAIFGETEIRYSLLTYPHAIWLIGIRNAKEVMMLGEKFGAQRAHEYGLVNRVVPRSSLDAEVMAIARRLAVMPTETMQLMKHMITRAADMQGLGQMQTWGIDLFVLSKVMNTPEKDEFARLTREKGMRAALAWTRDTFGDDYDKERHRG